MIDRRKIPEEIQKKIKSMLQDGCGLRAVARATGVEANTVSGYADKLGIHFAVPLHRVGIEKVTKEHKKKQAKGYQCKLKRKNLELELSLLQGLLASKKQDPSTKSSAQPQPKN